MGGAADCALVCMEIEPGRNLGMHKDSEEELVLVLEGAARVRSAGRPQTWDRAPQS